MHSECLTGDVFGSQRCDCGAQLNAAMAAIAAEGRGIVVYLRGHEGRGIGLLSASCRPTSSRTRAPTRWTPTGTRVPGRRPRVLHRRADSRRPGGQLAAVADQQSGEGQGAFRLRAEGHGPGPMPVSATPHNLRYLIAKRDRLGHKIETVRKPSGEAAHGAGDAAPGPPVRRLRGSGCRRRARGVRLVRGARRVTRCRCGRPAAVAAASSRRRPAGTRRSPMPCSTGPCRPHVRAGVGVGRGTSAGRRRAAGGRGGAGQVRTMRWPAWVR